MRCCRTERLFDLTQSDALKGLISSPKINLVGAAFPCSDLSEPRVALPTLFDASLLNLQRAALGRLSFVNGRPLSDGSCCGRKRCGFIGAHARRDRSATGANPLTSVAKGPKSGGRSLTLTKTEQDKPRFWRLYCSCRIEGRLKVQADQIETMRVA